jgi:tungstate transport system permease protein
LLSFEVSLSAAVLACALGLPIGAWVAVGHFPGRRAVVVMLNAMLGLPSVVVGLVIYLLLSRAGPLGAMGILFTPAAIVVAQTLLVLPMVAALARQLVEDEWREYAEQLTSLGVSRTRAVPTLLWDARYSLLTVALAGFGRATSEVGAVMIVGGNIDGVTRVMTTAIALETSKGDLPLALALGIVLVAAVLTMNAAVDAIRAWSLRRHG